MRLGFPGGLLFYTYEPFIRTFFGELDIDVIYSLESSKEILELGRANCVDEACLPMKVFHGHVMKLQNYCDFIAVPRIVNCEKNQSICPKFDGLPELVRSGTKLKNYCLTNPLYLYDENQTISALTDGLKPFNVKKRKIVDAYRMALQNLKNSERGLNEWNYKYKILLLGHPYHVHDKFVNRNIIEKLHSLDIGVITEEWITKSEKKEHFRGLIKNPYWLFFMNNYGAAKNLTNNKSIDGILALSSFCCGTDAFILEMIKNDLSQYLPYMVIKLDEQSGDAGIDTRLEAFQEILKRKNQNKKETLLYENNLSSFGECSLTGKAVF